MVDSYLCGYGGDAIHRISMSLLINTNRINTNINVNQLITKRDRIGLANVFRTLVAWLPDETNRDF